VHPGSSPRAVAVQSPQRALMAAKSLVPTTKTRRAIEPPGWTNPPTHCTIEEGAFCTRLWRRRAS
jgi:hypothetical protein